MRRTSSTSRPSPRTSPATRRACCSTPSRSGSSAATGSASSGSTAGARRRCSTSSPAAASRRAGGSAGSAGCAWRHLAQGDALPPGRGCATSCSSPATAPSTSGRPTRRCATSSTGCGAATTSDRTVDGLSGGEKRRVALARAAGRRPGPASCSTSRRTTSTSRASAGSPQHLIARRCGVVVVTHDRWFLDAVCTRTWEVAGGRGGELPRRLRRLGLRPGRARPAVRRGRGPPAQPRAQGAGLAAPRAARAHVEAAVPDRGGRGADRGRPAAAEHRRAARLRHEPARATVLELEDATVRIARAHAAGPGDLAARAGRPDRDRRGERVGQDDAAACADRGAAAGRRPARAGDDGAARAAHAGAGRPADGHAACWRRPRPSRSSCGSASWS